jgi:cytochrome c oxidase assembly protein subunit 15
MVSLLAVYLQIVLGAAVRHSEAALAIPDYPLAFGGLLPPLDRLSSLPVAIHFAHRLGAVALAVVLVITTWRAWMHHGDRVELRRPAALLVGLLLSKIILGGLIVLSGRNVLVSTAHVASGALLFGAALVLALRASRPFFGEALQPAPAAAVRVVKSGRR